MNLLDLMVKIGVDDQASDKIGGITSGITGKVGGAVKAAGAAVVGATAAVGAGAAAMTAAAVNGYASYEQLVGGVDKLYGDASSKLQGYAQDAYKTAGMSANQYMEQATSFSAALVTSLGGDVDKAADLTDVAMRAMSDNVNVFGSDMESVQNAFQGFAKENYTMLDNLKLGYAGTKEGAKQLVEAASKMTKEQEELGLTVDANSLSFDNMVAAIAVVQQNMEIAGTTSKEAMGTIEGSIASTKAAWDNFLTALGTGDEGLIENSVTGLVDGIFGTFNEETQKREGGVINNVIPVVQRVFESVGQALPQLVQQLGAQVAELAGEYLGIDTSKMQQDFEDAWGAIVQAFTDAKEKIGEVLDFIKTAWASFSEKFDTQKLSDAFGGVREVLENVWNFVSENILSRGDEIGELLGDAVNLIADVVTGVTDLMNAVGPFVPMVLGAVAALQGLSIIGTLVGFITGAVGAITTFATTIGAAMGMVQSFSGLIAVITTVCGGWIPILVAVAGAIVAFIATNKDAREAIKGAWEAIKGFFKSAWDAITKTFTSAGDTIQKAWQSVTNFFSTVGQSIANAFSNAGTWLYNAGANIISGLWNGLTTKWQEVQDWVGGIGQWIVDHKGPEAYDRELLVPAGGWIMGGLHEGMEDAFEREVKPYVKGLAGDMRDAFGTPQLATGLGTASAAGGMRQASQPRQLNIVLELDGVQFARAVYNANDEETQRVGVRLASQRVGGLA